MHFEKSKLLESITKTMIRNSGGGNIIDIKNSAKLSATRICYLIRLLMLLHFKGYKIKASHIGSLIIAKIFFSLIGSWVDDDLTIIRNVNDLIDKWDIEHINTESMVPILQNPRIQFAPDEKRTSEYITLFETFRDNLSKIVLELNNYVISLGINDPLPMEVNEKIKILRNGSESRMLLTDYYDYEAYAIYLMRAQKIYQM